MNRIIQIIFISILIACNKEDVNESITNNVSEEFVKAVDISSYPEISISNPVFFDLEQNENNFLTILKNNGVNTIRLRLWVNPTNEHSSYEEVKQFSQTIKDLGFKLWLTLHYSDTWADPGHQYIPNQWSGLDFNLLKDSLKEYTKKVVTEINPNYIQIGNEINNGILHPFGDISSNYQNFITLIQEGCSAVRENSDNCKIIIHFAGIKNSDFFFDQLNEIDYDIIGLSYYPIWHGKSLNNLKNTMESLSEKYNKEIIIAETAYPFTLSWNDWTNNIVGSDNQLILPEYPASPEGQRHFILDIKSVTQEIESGIGFCYWGAELIAWKGNQSTDASPWENQALFNFNNEALPVLRSFNSE